MKTVAQVVEEVLERSPFLLEALSEGVANNAQVARKIRPQVEEVLYEEVSEASVAMAVHRLAKRFKKQSYAPRCLKNYTTSPSGLTWWSLYSKILQIHRNYWKPLPNTHKVKIVHF